MTLHGFCTRALVLESPSPTPKRDSWGCYPIYARHSAVAVANSRMIQTDKETLKTLSVSFVPHKGRAISGQVRKTIDAPYITRGPPPRERDMALEDAFASHHHAAFSSEIHFLTAIFTSLGGSALQAARSVAVSPSPAP